MIRTELVRTLSLLDKKEREQLVLFLRSPLHVPEGKSDELVRLVELIFGGLKTNPDKLEKESLYRQFYGDEQVVANKLEKQFSQTLKYVRAFIKQLYFQHTFESDWESLAMAEFYHARKEFDTAQRIYSKLEKKQTEPPQGYYERFFELELERSKQTFLFRKYRKTGENNVQAILSALERFYWYEQSFRSLYLLSLNSLTPVIPQDILTSAREVIEKGQQSGFGNEEISKVLNQALSILCAENPSDDQFFEFLEAFMENQQLFDPLLLDHLEAFAINYCIRRYGQPRFRQAVFPLYQERLNGNRFLSVYGKMPASEYQSVVRVGLLEKEYDWVEQFIEENKNRIEGSQDSEYYYQFNLACLLFERGEYEAVLEKIAVLNLNETMYKAMLKTLEIKTLYEMENEALDSRVEAASVYFFRDKLLPEHQKQGFTNFVNFMRQLIHHSTAVNPERAQKLQQQLEESNAYAEYFWLKEKVDALIK